MVRPVALGGVHVVTEVELGRRLPKVSYPRRLVLGGRIGVADGIRGGGTRIRIRHLGDGEVMLGKQVVSPLGGKRCLMLVGTGRQGQELLDFGDNLLVRHGFLLSAAYHVTVWHRRGGGGIGFICWFSGIA